MNSVLQINSQFPFFFPTVFFLFGACVGSFLNVCIFRIPAGKSIVRPPSHCACGKPIAWHDNIPILGWILLRGRARCCGRRISFRYPLVETLTAAVFCAAWVCLPPVQALVGMVFLSILIFCSFVDIDFQTCIPRGLKARRFSRRRWRRAWRRFAELRWGLEYFIG